MVGNKACVVHTIRARFTIQGRQRQTKRFGICDKIHRISMKYANSIAISSQPMKNKINGIAMPISMLTSPTPMTLDSVNHNGANEYGRAEMAAIHVMQHTSDDHRQVDQYLALDTLHNMNHRIVDPLQLPFPGLTKYIQNYVSISIDMQYTKD
jgi:hypothetical protein